MTIETKATLVFLGQIDRYPRDKQLEDCREFAKAMDLPKIGRAVYEHTEFDELRKGCRGNEVVLLPRLGVLGLGKGRGVGNRFLTSLLKLTNQTMVIMDVHNGLSSQEFDAWYDHVETTLNRLTNSRKLTKGQASKLGSLPRTKPGIVEHWKKHEDKELYARMAQHWRDPKIPNAATAIQTFPDEELRKASRKTIERIFGARTTKR